MRGNATVGKQSNREKNRIVFYPNPTSKSWLAIDYFMNSDWHNTVVGECPPTTLLIKFILITIFLAPSLAHRSSSSLYIGVNYIGEILGLIHLCCLLLTAKSRSHFGVLFISFIVENIYERLYNHVDYTNNPQNKLESVQFLFLGETVKDSTKIDIPKREISAYQFCELKTAISVLCIHSQRRLQSLTPCLNNEQSIIYLENGQPI